MQNKLFAILITALLVLAMAGSAMCATYDSSVTLENKDVHWNVLDEDAFIATIDYNASGDEFAWHAYGIAPLSGECYALIYYADKPDRSVNWGGNNPGAMICDMISTDACTGEFDESGVIDLGINMPESPDWNMNPDPCDEYCSEETDNFTHCCGAKIWMVPCDILPDPYPGPNPGNGGWVPPFWSEVCQPNILFETDLIWYDDTNYNVKPSVIETTVDISCVSAGDTVLVGAVVSDGDGEYDLENMIVTTNMSVYGVDETVVLGYIGMIDCIFANYSANVLVTSSTVDECSRRHMTEFDIYAEDPSGANDSLEAYLDVEPGDCASLEIRDYYTGDEPETKALTKEYYCYDYGHNWYWDDQYELYHNRYSVYGYDIYGNCIGPIGGHECCDSFTATVDSPASLEYYGGQYYWWNHNYISVYNDGYPADVVLRAHCVDNSGVDSAELTISFLQSVSCLDVESDVSFVYVDECYNITAQIVDVYGEPIPMPCVDVNMYVNSEYIGDADTDDNGTAMFVCDGVYAVGTVSIRVEAECREGSLEIDVIDDVLDYVEIDAESPAEFGDEQSLTCTCYTNHSTEMCCDDGVWSCNEFGDVNETTGYFTAGDTEGVAVVEVNVSGVIGTVEIVINGIDCDGYAAYPEQGVEGNLTSGSVMVSWNYTGLGTVCVQALGDPIPEWSNDTKGAFVNVTSDDSNDTVTLDLNGTGDTWMLNDTTWEFYAAGDTSEVGLGIYQMFALVYDEPVPDPDPEPTPTATARSSSRGGGGGGTYPPDPTPTPDVDDSTDNETEQDDPKPAEAKPTVNLPGGDATLDTTPDDEDEAPGGADPTNAIFIVLGILALLVIGYVLYRKSQNGE